MLIITAITTIPCMLPTLFIILSLKNYIIIDANISEVNQSAGKVNTYYYVEYTYEGNAYKFISDDIGTTGTIPILINPKNPADYTKDIVSTSRGLFTTGMTMLIFMSIPIGAELIAAAIHMTKDRIKKVTIQ